MLTVEIEEALCESFPRDSRQGSPIGSEHGRPCLSEASRFAAEHTGRKWVPWDRDQLLPRNLESGLAQCLCLPSPGGWKDCVWSLKHLCCTEVSRLDFFLHSGKCALPTIRMFFPFPMCAFFSCKCEKKNDAVSLKIDFTTNKTHFSHFLRKSGK